MQQTETEEDAWREHMVNGENGMEKWRYEIHKLGGKIEGKQGKISISRKYGYKRENERKEEKREREERGH